MTMIIGVATSLPLLLAMMFCVSDLDAVANSQLPSLEVTYQAYVHVPEQSCFGIVDRSSTGLEARASPCFWLFGC